MVRLPIRKSISTTTRHKMQSTLLDWVITLVERNSKFLLVPLPQMVIIIIGNNIILIICILMFILTVRLEEPKVTIIVLNEGINTL